MLAAGATRRAGMRRSAAGPDEAPPAGMDGPFAAGRPAAASVERPIDSARGPADTCLSQLCDHPSRRPMNAAVDPDLECVAGVRRFSRFYTQRLGLLDRELMSSGFTLSEARVLWELAQRAPLTASRLCRDLGLDAGYLSRLVRRLRAAGMVREQASREDARTRWLSLTAKGAQLRRRMWPVYGRAIHEAVGMRLDAGEARTLARLLVGRLEPLFFVAHKTILTGFPARCPRLPGAESRRCLRRSR